jgi:hypothetical protein
MFSRSGSRSSLALAVDQHFGVTGHDANRERAECFVGLAGGGGP